MAEPAAASVRAREQGISRDKLANFKGSCRIFIKHLYFPNPARPVDEKIIEQLQRDFDGEGCLREEPSNRVPVIIDDLTLQEGLKKLGYDAETFKAKSAKPPLLRLGSRVLLECLHGQHRIVAAKRYLTSKNRWWVADLYGTGLTDDTKQALREGYSYSAKYRSGEIFRYLRLCNLKNDSLGVKRWRSKLTPHQDKYLEVLLHRPLLINALDSVIHFEGFWRTFYIGSLDIFFIVRFDEEVKHYIEFMKIIWSHIFKGTEIQDAHIPLDFSNMSIDAPTVESLQSRAPALSKSDYEFVESNMRSGQLFPEVTSSEERNSITSRLLALYEPIPTLYSLIRDVRYYKEPAALLRTLLPKPPKSTARYRYKTLREGYEFHFENVDSDATTITIQETAIKSKTIQLAGMDAFDVSYQQLWLCACRICKLLDAHTFIILAALARSAGFSSPQIEREAQKAPAEALIEKAITDALYILRPNEKFPFDASQARSLTALFAEYIERILKAPITTALPYITVAPPGESLSHRCGSSYKDVEDRNHLFLETVHAPLEWYQRGGDEISSFYVKRARHMAFFGQLKPARSTQETPSVPLSPTESEHPAETQDSAPATSEQFSLREQASQWPTQNQIVEYVKQVRFQWQDSSFVEIVPYERKAVNDKARKFASMGLYLWIDERGWINWQDCFDMLEATGGLLVKAIGTIETALGKRGTDNQLQPPKSSRRN